MASLSDTAEQLKSESPIKSQLYGIDVSSTVLATIAVILRFWARSRTARIYGWDDWLVLICLVFLFANFVINVVMIENGLGLQADEVTAESLMRIQKMIYADELIYLILLALVKVTILVMYCRIFPLRSYKIAAWILASVTVTWSLMFIFICVFQCSPVARAWNSDIPGTCLNLRAVFIGNAIPNIVTDAIILAMPLYSVWKLQVRTAQRIALTGIFLLGAFVLVASIYRLTVMMKLDKTNMTYKFQKPATWSHVECAVALICACLPVMKPLLTAFLHFVGIQTSSQRSGITGYGDVIASSSVAPSRRTKASPGLTTAEFAVLDSGRDDIDSNDELPLKGIQVTHGYEQKVETSPKSDGWSEDGTRRSWYPGQTNTSQTSSKLRN